MGAQFGGDFQAVEVDVGAQHDDVAGTAQPCHQQRHDADGTGSLDHHQVAGLHRRGFLDQGVVGHADRLGQRGVLEGHVVGDVVQDLGAGGDVAGEGAIGQRAVAQAIGAEVVVAGQAVDTLAADRGRGLAGHAVARPGSR